jgi:hypothetical protein
MNNGEAICIQRVGNGWIVCSALGVGADDTVSFSETLVFNDMGLRPQPARSRRYSASSNGTLRDQQSRLLRPR